MKKILIILIIFILILGGIYYILQKTNYGKNKITEYTPAEEITQEQLLQTEIILYFKNKENNVLNPEIRKINAKELIINPYEIMVNLLIQGPKSENLCKTMPEGTRFIKSEIVKGIVHIDLSQEFIDNQIGGEEEQKLIIESLLNTLAEFTEVGGIKILINGEENLGFKNDGIKFDNTFVKIN